MFHRTITWTATVLLAGLVATTGCTDSSATPTAPGQSGSSVNDPGNSGGSAGGSATLSMAITDSPFSDAKAVLVTFNEVSVHRSEGDGWENVPFAGGASSRTCDLKKLEGPTDVLGAATLPAGHYTQIRLSIESAAIYFDNASASGPCAATIAAPAGSSASLDVPSDTIKLNREFTLEAGGVKQITLDFDGDRSIRQLGGGGPNGNGNGNGRGNSGSSSEEDASGGRYSMNPVISVVSVQ